MNPPFFACQLAYAQAAAAGFRPDTATIYRPPTTVTRKPSGAPLDTYPTYWQTVETGVKCRITVSRLSGIEGTAAGKVQATGYYNVAFPKGTVIDETCRFRITASLYNSQLVGVDFDVKEAPLPSIETERLVRATKTL